jgi:PST family polysaccharide transporter
MIRRIQNVLAENKVVLENFSFLSILQLTNLLLFFLLIPYLFRVLGKENYGIVVFAQTVSNYLSILVNFGLNATATRDISMNRDNPAKRSLVISSVLIIKISFFLISFLTILMLVLITNFFGNHAAVFIFSMLYCLSEALFPIWYFQGIEKMKYITYINLGTRVISAALVFIIIKRADDYYLVPLLLGLGTFIGSVVGLVYILSIKGNRFKWLPVRKIRKSINYNLPMFFSNVSSQVYVNGNRLIVGTILGMQVLAIYDTAERIVNMVKVPLSVIAQVLFPKVSKDSDINFVKRSMKLTTLAYVLIYFLLFILSGKIIYLFTGTFYHRAILITQILGLSIIPISAGLFYSELLLVPFGFLKDYARVRVNSLVLYILILVILFSFNYIGEIQLSLTVILVELFVLYRSYFFSKKNGLLLVTVNDVNG